MAEPLTVRALAHLLHALPPDAPVLVPGTGLDEGAFVPAKFGALTRLYPTGSVFTIDHEDEAAKVASVVVVSDWLPKAEEKL